MDKKETCKENNTFDFKAVMNYKRKVPIVVTEKNKPNIDRMAEAFYNLLKK